MFAVRSRPWPAAVWVGHDLVPSADIGHVSLSAANIANGPEANTSAFTLITALEWPQCCTRVKCAEMAKNEKGTQQETHYIERHGDGDIKLGGKGKRMRVQIIRGACTHTNYCEETTFS